MVRVSAVRQSSNMVRISSIALAAVLLAGAFVPAAAQLGAIFGNNPPPRPPGDVPGRPGSDFDRPTFQYPSSLPPPGMAPGPAPPPQSSAIQSQPLPPPPGAAAAPAQPGASGLALPGAPGQPGGSQPATASVTPPTDEVVIEPPAVKIVNPTAVFAGLDKITGRIISFDVKIGETVQFGALQVTPRACYTRPPTENANTDGFVEVAEVTLKGEVKSIFSGWMFAASPGLHAVEHPVYDVWLTDCKGGAPTVTAEAPAEGAPATSQQRPARPPPPPRRTPPAQQQALPLPPPLPPPPR
jgi:hypothetical protein